MLHYLWMLVVGIFVGLIARALLPGAQHMGILMTGILGIAGSLAGGLIVHLIKRPADGALFHPAGIVMSVIGAMGILYGYTHFR